MRIRWSRKSAVPLLLLAILYAAGAAQLTQRYSRCEWGLPLSVAAALDRAERGWDWFTNASSRLRIGSWLGNSWAPGSMGWRSASASGAKPGSTPMTVQAAAPSEASRAAWRQIEPPGIFATIDGRHRFRVVACATRPVILARPQVVIVTAEFSRLPVFEAGVEDLPQRADPPESPQLPFQIDCLSQLPDPSTI